MDAEDQDIPKEISDYLDDGAAKTCAFNRRGSLLAVGMNDGKVLVYDFDTGSVASALMRHTGTICTLSWSLSGRKLASCSIDGHVIVWSVADGTVACDIDFGTKVLSAFLRPRQSNQLVVCLLDGPPILVDISNPESPVQTQVPVPNAAGKDGPATGKYVAGYNRRGDRLYVGSPRGQLMYYDADKPEQPKHLAEVCSKTNGVVGKFAFSKNDKMVIVNCTDKVLRVVDADELQVIHKFQDHVDRSKWCAFSFSASGEQIIGGAEDGAVHHIFVWNLDKGNLIRILEGPKAGLVDVAWHPTRPTLVSISAYGMVLIWSITYTENWSAFAPDFQELTHNIEYIEREDEFDDVDPQEQQDKALQDVEDVVDILTVEEDRLNGSEDDQLSDDELTYLPVQPIDEAEEAQAQKAVEADAAAVNAAKKKEPSSTKADDESAGPKRKAPGQRHSTEDRGRKSKKRKPKSAASSSSSSSSSRQRRPSQKQDHQQPKRQKTESSAPSEVAVNKPQEHPPQPQEKAGASQEKSEAGKRADAAAQALVALGADSQHS